MDICYEDMGDGFVCMQTSDHLSRDIPHLRYEDGIRYWKIRNVLESVAEYCTDPYYAKEAYRALYGEDK